MSSHGKNSVVPQCTESTFSNNTAKHIKVFQSDMKTFNRSYQLYVKDLKIQNKYRPRPQPQNKSLDPILFYGLRAYIVIVGAPMAD